MQIVVSEECWNHRISLVKGIMALTIAEAARQWHIGREAIYRRQLRGELKFTTSDPPSVEASEMRRVFGKPSSTKGPSDAAILSRVEVICDGLRGPIENLLTQLAAFRQDLQAEREEIRRDRTPLSDFLASQTRLLEDKNNTIAPGLQRGEMAEAQVVLAAQQRIDTPQLKQRDCDIRSMISHKPAQ